MRLLQFAVISQIPFSLAFTAGNYGGSAETLFSFDPLRAVFLLLPLGVYFLTVCRRRFEPSLLWLAAAFVFASTDLTLGGVTLLAKNHLNVFYTLAAAMAVMTGLDRLRSEERDWLRALLILAALAVVLYFVQPHADYEIKGVALIAALYLCRKRRWTQLAAAALWCLAEYRWCIFDYPQYLAFFLAALAALLLIALYNGKLGPKMRTFFYVFYPAHLALLGAMFVFLSRI